jgi:hypothetical protein
MQFNNSSNASNIIQSTMTNAEANDADNTTIFNVRLLMSMVAGLDVSTQVPLSKSRLRLLQSQGFSVRG